MKRKYRVLVEGRNFWIKLDDRPRRLGFYANRFCEADDEANAERCAMDLIRRELATAVLNDRSDPPEMYLEQIDELTSFDGLEPPGAGFTWFAEQNDA